MIETQYPSAYTEPEWGVFMSIAVLVTTHDASAFVGESLESISRQERRPDEVIVIDDKSKDCTLDIVRTWAKLQPFEVQILENQFSHEGYPTPGPAGSRTTGMHRTNADLIAVLDDDDLMLPSHLRVTEQALMQYPGMELCFGDATEFDGDGSHHSLFSGKKIEGLAFRVAEHGLRILTEPMLEPQLTQRAAFLQIRALGRAFELRLRGDVDHSKYPG